MGTLSNIYCLGTLTIQTEGWAVVDTYYLFTLVLVWQTSLGGLIVSQMVYWAHYQYLLFRNVTLIIQTRGWAVVGTFYLFILADISLVLILWTHITDCVLGALSIFTIIWAL